MVVKQKWTISDKVSLVIKQDDDLDDDIVSFVIKRKGKKNISGYFFIDNEWLSIPDARHLPEEVLSSVLRIMKLHKVNKNVEIDKRNTIRDMNFMKNFRITCIENNSYLDLIECYIDQYTCAFGWMSFTLVRSRQIRMY